MLPLGSLGHRYVPYLQHSHWQSEPLQPQLSQPPQVLVSTIVFIFTDNLVVKNANKLPLNMKTIVETKTCGGCDNCGCKGSDCQDPWKCVAID
ncbi:unnamed protein product [Oppiella nova]|uniref:Uncharacterized protein n=1 Tax=Oppiella nova TaxID=334625 RepID=A0A7R9MIM0_9ACAR|nr:unnamed protein product [Oppiella nova]CAG2177079.1 unnamed protein product [Oppiella nova]